MNISLVKEFPHFLFASDADRFLQNFKNNKDIVSQLNNRRIHKVKFEQLLSSGGLGATFNNYRTYALHHLTINMR